MSDYGGDDGYDAGGYNEYGSHLELCIMDEF